MTGNRAIIICYLSNVKIYLNHSHKKASAPFDGLLSRFPHSGHSAHLCYFRVPSQPLGVIHVVGLNNLTKLLTLSSYLQKSSNNYISSGMTNCLKQESSYNT